MNRLEFVARRLCAADGCPADLPAISANRQLMRTPVVQIWPPDAAPAWQFYIQKAYDVLCAADLYAEMQGKTDEEFADLAKMDRWSSKPDWLPKELQADRDMLALRIGK